MPQVPKLLRPQEAAELLGCSKAHIYNLHADGDLDGVYVGRATKGGGELRILADSVTAFIKGRASLRVGAAS